MEIICLSVLLLVAALHVHGYLLVKERIMSLVRCFQLWRQLYIHVSRFYRGKQQTHVRCYMFFLERNRVLLSEEKNVSWQEKYLALKGSATTCFCN
jgi:hypothetical protein